MNRTLFESASAARRIEAAIAFVCRGLDEARTVTLVAPSREAGRELVRRVAAERGAVSRVEPTTLFELALRLSRRSLLRRHETFLPSAGLDALVLRAMRATPALGRYEAVRELPGTARAIGSALEELLLADLAPEAVIAIDPTLAALFARVRDELGRERLVPEATLLARATAARNEGRAPGLETLVVLDLHLSSGLEIAFARALIRGAEAALVTVPEGDPRARWAVGQDLDEERDPGGTACARALFRPTGIRSTARGPSAREPSGARAVTVLSGNTEADECVEIARALLAELDRPEPTPLDRMAIAIRDVERYRVPIVEALTRAGIPHHLERGARRPDPAGRAFLSLLECATSGLSAHAFADYLAFGVLPPSGETGAPRSLPARGEASDRSAEEVLDAEDVGGDEATKSRSVIGGALRAPRRWERLLVDAAVIGGEPERWRRRLEGLCEELRRAIDASEDPDSPEARRAAARMLDLERLSAFALPLVARLSALPRSAPWTEMLPALEDLARVSLADPRRVLEVLAQLAPLARISPALGVVTSAESRVDAPVALDDVRRILLPRLREITGSPVERGRSVRILSMEAIAGRDFELVFVPGLVERSFPRRMLQDPILSDAARDAITEAATDADDGSPRALLETTRERAEGERSLLLRAAQAAPRLVCSYPRRDEKNRARVPSLYLLELVRADRGELLSSSALARESAETERAAGWPAPRDVTRAIDQREADLSHLSALLRGARAEARGRAAHLLSENPILGRSVRARHSVHLETWGNLDGLLSADASVSAMLAPERLATRTYSATALESWSACPYRFFLRSVVRLKAREVAEPLETLDPRTRGSLIHAMQFAVIRLAKDAKLSLHDDEATLRDHLDRVIDDIAADARDRLAPAIDSVFDEEIASIRRDLRGWLHELARETAHEPAYAELGFGEPGGDDHDPASAAAPVVVSVPRSQTLARKPKDESDSVDSVSAKLRGSIDLVERGETSLRATDYKTGKAKAKHGTRIGAGQTLQPLLYALVLEGMLERGLLPTEASATRVEGGRLWYCTPKGENRSVVIALDEAGRRAIGEVLTAIDRSLEEAFLPRAPAPEACGFCDYLVVCGPGAETRAARKRPRPSIEPLFAIRSKS